MFQVFHILSFSTCFCLSLATCMNGLVETPSGRIEGEITYHKGIPVRTFLGIPFVKPPVGDLRFKRPVPVEPWNITLQAKAMRSGCIQYSPNPFPWLDDLPGLSEDCLYLNVWAPLNTDNLNRTLTVMFWIHTGGFRISSSRLDFFNGLALAAEGDVIVVTTNYRLGPQGFLYSGTEDAPGNMGLWDMVEALKWVRSNIEAFGGDKDKITLFGHSSGGIAIGMFCVSPVTRGLFKRAIMQSGSPTNLDGEDNDRSFYLSEKLAETVGCTDDTMSLRKDPGEVIGCLGNVDAMMLAKTLSNITANDSRSFYPRFGDELLPQNSRHSIIDGDFAAVDLLIGTNNGDGSQLITAPMKNVFGFFGEKDPQINYTFGESIIRKQFKNYPDPDAVVNQYLGGVEEQDFDKIRLQVFTASGDYARVCPSVYFAESFAKKGTRVYYYFFTHRPSNSPWAPWMLASHFEETPFVFGYPLRYSTKYTLNEHILSRRMIQAWSNFAKTGNVSYGVWPNYSFENPNYQVLDVNNEDTGYGPHRSNCNFFRHVFGF